MNTSGFVHYYKSENWEQTTPGDSTINITDTSATLCGSDASSNNPQETNMCISIPCDGTVSFSWEYASGSSHQQYDPFGYILNGDFVQLTVDGPTALEQSGSEQIPVKRFDRFCFSQRTVDDTEGRGHTTITSFSAPEGGPKFFDQSVIRCYSKCPPKKYKPHHIIFPPCMSCSLSRDL